MPYYRKAGEIVEVDAVTAVALVHRGEAEHINQYEAAVIEQREMAVMPRPRKR